MPVIRNTGTKFSVLEMEMTPNVLSKYAPYKPSDRPWAIRAGTTSFDALQLGRRRELVPGLGLFKVNAGS